MSKRLFKSNSETREKYQNFRTANMFAYLNTTLEIFYPKEGKNAVRIVPKLADDHEQVGLWGMDVWTYYLNNQGWLAPNTFDKSLPDPVMALYNVKRVEDPDFARSISPLKRTIMFVLDVDDGSKLKVWPAPAMLVDTFVPLLKIDRTGEMIALEDPEEGRVVFFIRQGTGRSTKYVSPQLGTEPCPLKISADEVPYFKDILIVPSVKDIQEALDSHAEVTLGATWQGYNNIPPQCQNDKDENIDFPDFYTREPEGSIAHQVKQIPIEEVWKYLHDFGVANLLKGKPQEHQLRSLLLGILYEQFLFCLDMGLGKARIAVDIVQCRRRICGGNSRTLVTCPPSLVLQWGEEISKNSSLTSTLIEGSKNQKRIKFLTAKTDFVIVSHRWIVTQFEDEYMASKLYETSANFTNLIIDESYQIKNYKSKGFKGYKKYFSSIPCRYLFTETPVEKDFAGIFSQYYMVDKGKSFGTEWPPFQRKFFNVRTDVENPHILHYIMKLGTKKEFMQRFWSMAIRWEKE